MKKIITFASNDFYDSAEYLRLSYFMKNDCDEFIIFTEKMIEDFIDEHKNYFINSKGFGWWVWKPYIIYKTLLEMNDNDILCYIDSGIIVNNDLSMLFNYLNDYDDIFFYVGEKKKNKEYTKSKTFQLMNCEEDKYYTMYQVMGGFHIHKKTENSMILIKEWLDYCLDLECINEDTKEMHRHDQSILTNVVCKYQNEYKIKCLRDPCQYGVKDIEFEGNYPILITCHRQKLELSNPKVVIITPSIGHTHLEKCIESVQNQSYIKVKHIIVIDGDENDKRTNIVKSITNKYKHYKKDIMVMNIPCRTGEKNWNGHRIYSALPHLLVDADYICFLDEDNMIETNHIESMMNTLLNGELDWVYCLRKIIDQNDNVICNDDCESLGSLSNTCISKNDYLIDTSCYMLSRKICMEITPLWNSATRGDFEPDREICKYLIHTYKNHGCTELYTLNYYTNNRSDSVSSDFFVLGNKILKWKPEKKGELYLYHFSNDATVKCLSYPRVKKNNCVEYVYDTRSNWHCMMMEDILHNYICYNGYNSVVKSGSLIFVNLCLPNDIPYEQLKRKDIFKVGYTMESPNIRHQKQWSKEFLDTFDIVLTYWRPLIDNIKYVYCPFMQHLDVSKKVFEDKLMINECVDTSKCIVLANRKLSGVFEINGVKLKCLDNYREIISKSLDNVDFYGEGWENGKVFDNHSVYAYNKYTFGIVVENTTAEGYVSEKLYQVLIAGGIPIYLGGNDGLIPKDCYIDIKDFKDLEELNEYINTMTKEEIIKMKENIVKKRKDILINASSSKMYQLFEEIVIPRYNIFLQSC